MKANAYVVIINIFGSCFVIITFWLAENISVEIRNVRIIITEDNKSIKILLETNTSPDDGRRDNEAKESHKKVNVLVFHRGFEF